MTDSRLRLRLRMLLDSPIVIHLFFLHYPPGSFGQMSGDFHGIFTVPGHSQMKRFQALEEQKGRKGAHATAHIAKQMRAALDDVGNVTDRFKSLGQDDAVI